MTGGSRQRPTELLSIVLEEVREVRGEVSSMRRDLEARLRPLEDRDSKRQGSDETRSKIIGLVAGGFGALVAWILTRLGVGN